MKKPDRQGWGLIILLVAGLVFWLRQASVPDSDLLPVSQPIISVSGPLQLKMEGNSLLADKMTVIQLKREQINSPLMTVTGSVVAHLKPGDRASEDRWQFNSVELSSLYADWQKARTEMDFANKQLAKTRELTRAQMDSQQHVVERLRKLVATGTEATRDLSAAEAYQLEVQLQGQKDVFQAETELSNAIHSHADLERRLVQAGADPALLQQVETGAVLVMADVPEVRISLVATGQSCVAHFYGLPEHPFSGVLRSLAPSLSPERRTLRVFFELNDPESRLKPGMYAEIGLGTDARSALLIPPDALLHIGQQDFVLVADSHQDEWKVTRVRAGDRAGDRVEILEGLAGTETIIAQGAILLKPLVVQALLAAERVPVATP
jgi:multidrug efflux pump subunit AcrA (membrane-fusion protein)